jgi:hypothetical protein
MVLGWVDESAQGWGWSKDPEWDREWGGQSVRYSAGVWEGWWGLPRRPVRKVRIGLNINT